MNSVNTLRMMLTLITYGHIPLAGAGAEQNAVEDKKCLTSLMVPLIFSALTHSKHTLETYKP